MPCKDQEEKIKYARTHYRANREKYKARAKEYLSRRLTEVAQYKAERGCFFCSETDPVCLDLHHRDPREKEFAVATMARSHGKARIAAEIAKCEVICSNCHRKVHAGKLVLQREGPATRSVS